MSRSSSNRRGLRATVGLLALIGGITACELDKVNVPRTTSTLVVHGVLLPNAPNQVILLEHTLTGSRTVRDSAFDPLDPIVTDGGVPESNATVEIIDSAGFAVRGIEDRTVLPDGRGAGVYRVPIAANSLRMGGVYRLRVRTTAGEELTASTRIPRPSLVSSGGLTRTFNRDHDTLVSQWSAVPFARAYALRVEGPFGPFFLFTDSTRFALTGGLRNLFANDLPHLFIPGFRQDMLISAVDSNFFDYYRTNNDPFTGSGIISRINGGLGLFGSLVWLNTGTITTVADQTEPIEGRWRITAQSSGAVTLVTTLNLYVESPAANADAPAAISGRWTGNGVAGGLIGTLRGTAVSFAVLNGQLAGDTIGVWVGEMTGTNLVGTYVTHGGNIIFAKQ